MNRLDTGRLELHPFTVDDADFVLRLLNEPSFLHYIGDRGVRTLADARQCLQANGIQVAVSGIDGGMVARL